MAAVRRHSGVMLIECMVYVSVFAILLGIGTAAFYFCWDHSRALIYATNDIAAALRAGERWRADVRGATGIISVTNTASGETVQIPQAENKICYRFENGGLRREILPANISRLVLPKVKTSEMTTEPRGGVIAWRWELELAPRRKETVLPLRFTFAAAQPQP